MKKIKLIALFAALIAGFGIYQLLREISKPQETPRTTVVVASVDIRENTLITADMVELRPVATEALLPNYVRDLDSVVGMVLSSNVYAGEQIVTNRLVRMGENDSQSNTLAYVVEPGMRAISISVNQVSGVSHLIKPGNMVDLIVNYAYEEETEGAQQTKTVTASRMMIQNKRVLAVGSTLSKEGEPEYITLTLEVTPQEAVEISYAEYTSSIRVLLRSSLDTQNVDSREINLEDLREKAGAGK